MTTAEMAKEKTKKKFKFPTAFTILVIITFVIAVLTRVIPAGRYDYNDLGEPIPGTYHAVEANPQYWRQAIAAPINGMYGIQAADGTISIYNTGALYGAIDVALFILLIGGFLGVTLNTVLMIIFAAGGTSYGMAEESLAFYPLIIAAMIALGYDALSAVAIIM